MKPLQTKKSRRRSALVGALALGLVLTGCGGGSTESADTSQAAAPATSAAAEAAPANDFPDFVGNTADGGQIEFASLEGQDTVLWFWAPW